MWTTFFVKSMIFVNSAMTTVLSCKFILLQGNGRRNPRTKVATERPVAETPPKPKEYIESIRNRSCPRSMRRKPSKRLILSGANRLKRRLRCLLSQAMTNESNGHLDEIFKAAYVIELYSKTTETPADTVHSSPFPTKTGHFEDYNSYDRRF